MVYILTDLKKRNYRVDGLHSNRIKKEETIE